MVDGIGMWESIGVAAASITAIIAAAYAIRKASHSIWVSLQDAVSIAVDHSDTGKLVKYHLGPNGTTPAIHDRIRRIEVAQSVEKQERDHSNGGEAQ